MYARANESTGGARHQRAKSNFTACAKMVLERRIHRRHAPQSSNSVTDLTSNFTETLHPLIVANGTFTQTWV